MKKPFAILKSGSSDTIELYVPFFMTRKEGDTGIASFNYADHLEKAGYNVVAFGGTSVMGVHENKAKHFTVFYLKTEKDIWNAEMIAQLIKDVFKITKSL